MVACALGLLVAWITIANLAYLLTQIAVVVDGSGVVDVLPHVARFFCAEFRDLVRIPAS